MNNEKQVKPMDPFLKNTCAGAALFIVFLLFFLFSFSVEVKSMTGAVSARSVPQAVSILGMITSLYLTLKTCSPIWSGARRAAGKPAAFPAGAGCTWPSACCCLSLMWR